jgi:tetratricopeptide (TPR) repeat protein
VLAALAILSIRQAGFWRDDMVLFGHNIEVNPRSFLAYNNRGGALLREQKVDDAERDFRAAIDIKSDYADARDNLATVLAQTGRVEQSIEQVAKVLQIARTMPPALRPGRLPQNLYGFGQLLMSRRRYAEAAEQFRAALELKPDFDEAREKLTEARLKESGGGGEGESGGLKKPPR